MTSERLLDEKDLRKLVRLFVASNAQQLSLDLGYMRVDIDKWPSAESVRSAATEVTIASPAGAPRPAPAADAGTGADPALVEVRSPGVGIVRWPPYIGRDTPLDVGDRVEAGEELCSLDVLGKPTPVVAPIGGAVAEVCVEDVAFVEYGHVLLRLKPDHP